DKRARNELFVGREREIQLEKMVDTIKREGRGRDYDCIIGVSGGVDSTMVAYHMKQLGLRSLAVHLDNGWNSELAVCNIKQTLDTLGIDLITHVIDWEEFRDLQLSFLKASVPNCEIPTDHAINALMINTALKTGARFILTGSNLATEAIMPLAWGYHNQDLIHIRAIHRQFGTIPLKTFPTLSLPKFLWTVMVRGVKLVPILNYLNYKKTEAKELIQKELGWRDYGGKHFESIYTRFFQGYILPRKFGYDKRRAHLSTLVASGQMARDEALREMKNDVYGGNDLQQDLEFVIKKFGLTEAQFEEIMTAAPKRHTDYPSNYMIYEKLTSLKKIFKRIATRV
ncbi:MAG: N-acetyl sugar amidotransferase, partial [Planctomycetes bacterium]|nr:N-acetyl sugar amidotransferase [Planctomycetota bacterium]